ncbi:erythromycin resistance leader peptide, partial [Staphylococcus aureus]|nr:erythromycin resistance leader peptide [Staphylococcus aureus]
IFVINTVDYQPNKK